MWHEGKDSGSMKLIYDLRHNSAFLRICEKPATVETTGGRIQ